MHHQFLKQTEHIIFKGVFIIKFEFNIYSGKTSVVNKKMSLETPRTVYGNFKALTDEYEPTILISLADNVDFDITRYNYCKLVLTVNDSDTLDWKERNKYYYVKSVRSIGKDLYEFSLELDVLMTYRVELSKQTFIIDRNSKHFNMYVADNGHYARAYTITYSNMFPNGFSDMYSYVLSTVGIVT